ncbi:MAG: TM2 domain-containing protein [Alicyclobacillus mali]|uniref:TM2 domain-containing protein n=1 Tax=Alicyclobacillus mali (ex Roth et al. 2021) TaxID=1123961 RepID=UPI0023F56B32|nr:TM2 domain-containing protein [Alicyclobacillus mali (ex Roth et al. 2021)]MCL6489884.1 TM2 domain-containing protein [Alicyclobacillus mali (ex Roth et al. 2021)]
MSKTITTTVQTQKSLWLAYVLWFFLGSLGIHRFYLGRIKTGIAQLVLGIVGWATVAFIVGFIILPILGIWLLVDAFLIPGMVRKAPPSQIVSVSQTISTEENQ